MTQPEHPSAERISDLLAGVLPASDAMDVNAHLVSCEACRDERTALIDLSRLLAVEGASEIEMPSEVAASIDEAIRQAAAERAGVVVATEPGRRPAGRQPWRWLAGAAAAVVVVGVGFAGLRALPQQNADTASADHAGTSAHQPSQLGGAVPSSLGGESAHPPGTDSIPQAVSGGSDYSSLPPAGVPARARMLASAPQRLIAPASKGCATPTAGGPSTVVRFKGHLAVLAITPDTRLATIYDCATATRTLFLTGY